MPFPGSNSPDSYSPIDRLRKWVLGTADPDRFSQLPKEAPVPLIWILGKTGSGKSSIIQFLTGAEEATIGGGFRPETMTPQQFAFPDQESPLVRFLDTRGLGEAGYDADDDLQRFGAETNLLIVTVRASDHANQGLVEAVKSIRKRHPNLPSALVITALHDAFPGELHPPIDSVHAFIQSAEGDYDSLPKPLQQCLRAQAQHFTGLFDKIVAIDLTKPEDGFDPCDYGGEELIDLIQSLVPAGMRQCLATMEKLKEDLQSSHAKSVEPLILAHATMAGAAAVVPIAWVDIPFVMGVQTHMAHRIAKMHGMSLDASAFAVLSPVLGTRAGARLLIRSTAKLIPVVGSAINSATAFALTYATGKVCHYYFTQVADGHAPSETEIQAIYKQQIDQGRQFWKSRNLGARRRSD